MQAARLNQASRPWSKLDSARSLRAATLSSLSVERNLIMPRLPGVNSTDSACQCYGSHRTAKLSRTQIPCHQLPRTQLPRSPVSRSRLSTVSNCRSTSKASALGNHQTAAHLHTHLPRSRIPIPCSPLPGSQRPRGQLIGLSLPGNQFQDDHARPNGSTPTGILVLMASRLPAHCGQQLSCVSFKRTFVWVFETVVKMKQVECVPPGVAQRSGAVHPQAPWCW